MVRPVTRADAATWCVLRTALWPEGGAEEHAMEIERFFWSPGDPIACLVAEAEGGVVGNLAGEEHGGDLVKVGG